jgi:ATPase subunit of ABC transporter with duplicated ATPase domains
VALLPQDAQVAFAGTVAAYLDSRSGALSRAWRAHEVWTAELAGARTDATALARYGEALEEMNRLGAWDYPQRRERVLEGLGLAADVVEREVGSLSGGEATRVALAGVLLAPANLVLLDEPSNNLDLESGRFLADWIRGSTASLLLVSHDRELLDAVIEEILEIDEESRRILLFGGNYSFYAERKRELFAAQLKRFEEQQQRRRQLEVSAERLAGRARRLESTSQNDFYRGKAARLARGASAQRARLERELGALAEPAPPALARFGVVPPALASGTLLRLQAVGFAYGTLTVLRSVSLSVRAGARVAVAGQNGSGKSTLLRLLAGELSPLEGSRTAAPGVRLGYLPQLSSALPSSRSVLDFELERSSRSAPELRAVLGKVLFGDPGRIRLQDLSRGELRRVELARLFADGPDVLLLDEPTNHLDLRTIDMLERALDEYTGAVVACSHDARFLERLRPDTLLRLGPGIILLPPRDRGGR